MSKNEIDRFFFDESAHYVTEGRPNWQDKTADEICADILHTIEEKNKCAR